MQRIVDDPEEIRKVYDFIRSKGQDYPDYLLWAEKCARELELGVKKAFMREDGGKVIASIVFQQHKGDSSMLEIKNARVEPGYRRQGVFKSLVRNVEKYSAENGYKRIILDSHSDEVIEVMRKLGYRVESHENLYSAALETVLVKDLISSGIIMTAAGTLDRLRYMLAHASARLKLIMRCI